MARKLALTALAALLASCSAAAPNILLIVADDLGFSDLGYRGSSIATPRIDALVKAGTVLGHYYVNICCSPTRAMLMTGRYDIRLGLQTQVIPNNRKYGLPLNETLLPQHLKALGYHTHAIGKWHLGLWKWEFTPTFRGYDSFLGYYSGSQDYFTHKDSGFDFRLDVGANCGQGCSKDVSHVYAGNYSTGVLAGRAETVVAQHPAAEPLFIYLPFQSVHAPIQVPDSYVAPYRHLDPNRRMFAGMVAAMDEAVGRVQDAFAAKADMWDNTWTFFSTDNGGPVGSLDGHPHGIGGATGSQNWPLRGGKGAYFQGGVRGTAWVHGAGLAPALKGTTTFALMHVTDLLPTIVGLAGGDVPSDAAFPLDGVDQRGVLQRGEASARTDLLVNIERHNPTTAAPRPNTHGCSGVGQYVAILGWHKIIIGGGGQPNTWYHDDKPYAGTEPTPNGGCLVACTPSNASACPATPMLQIFDLQHDEAERHNLAPAANASLLKALHDVIHKYNSSIVVDPWFFNTAIETDCPFVDEGGALTPCLK